MPVGGYGRRAPPPPPDSSIPDDDAPPPLPSRPQHHQAAAQSQRPPALRHRQQVIDTPPEPPENILDVSVEYVEPFEQVAPEPQDEYLTPTEAQQLPVKPSPLQEVHSEDSDENGWDGEFSDEERQSGVSGSKPKSRQVKSDSPPPPAPPPRKASLSDTDTHKAAVTPPVPIPDKDRTKKISREENPGKGIVSQLQASFARFQSASKDNGADSKPKPPPKQRNNNNRPVLPKKPQNFGSPSTEPTPVSKPNIKPLPEVPKLKKQDSEESTSGGSVSSGSAGHVPRSGTRGPILIPATGTNKSVHNLVNKVPVFPSVISPHASHQAGGGIKKHSCLPAVPPQEDDYPSDIYDDAVSNIKLENFPWFHGSIDRHEGRRRLETVNENGAFLVRDSKIAKYTLMVWLNGREYNLKIRERQVDNRLAIGEWKDDEVSFPDLEKLINHHMVTDVTVFGNGIAHSVKLMKSPSKR